MGKAEAEKPQDRLEYPDLGKAEVDQGSDPAWALAGPWLVWPLTSSWLAWLLAVLGGALS